VASQVAAGQADENAGQSRKSRLPLNRLEDFRYEHKTADPFAVLRSSSEGRRYKSLVGRVGVRKLRPAFYPIFFVACGQRAGENRVAKEETDSQIGANHVQNVIVAPEYLTYFNFLLWTLIN
jgi:hypothetical protein